jgi:TolB protein
MFARLFFCFVLVFVGMASVPARAAMTIEIVGGAASRIPIAIAPFLPAGTQGDDPSTVIRSDLQGSGMFTLADSTGLGVPGEAQVVMYPQWRTRGADALVVGQVIKMPDGRLNVRFRLYDVIRQTQLAGFSYLVPPARLRGIAHKISNVVYEKLIGVPGNFDGRIAYILKRGGRYELQVADADGYNNVMVMRSPEPILSPVWSPDGSKLAYVSFERKRPVVFIQSLATGKRFAVANFRGSNFAPAWSPDGRQLAVVLSKDSSSQIYLMAAEGGTPTRLTHGGALDTEPAFSPDGSWIYFTSDRGGSPQIYKMRSSGGSASRITFDGSYNVSPTVSPDGRYLSFVHQDGDGFHIAVMELATGQVEVLTGGPSDESPHFSPNSRTILYAAHEHGREVLAMVSTDGRVRQRLSIPGDLRSPSWAPERFDLN